MSTNPLLEQAILTRVREQKSTGTPELIQQLTAQDRNIRDTDVRNAVGSLIDRGAIVVAKDWKLAEPSR